MTKKVPDSITSWQTTAFAMHPSDGIGILKEPINVQFGIRFNFGIFYILEITKISRDTFKMTNFMNMYMSMNFLILTIAGDSVFEI